MHRLIQIKRVQLLCPKCGEQASVGAGRNRITVTGHMIGKRLMACEECLQYWRLAHKCQVAVAAA
jgi:hypothetical protein